MSSFLVAACAVQMLISIGILIWARRSHVVAEQRYRALAFEIGVNKAQLRRLVEAGREREAATEGPPTPSFRVAPGDYRRLATADRRQMTRRRAN